MDAGAAIFWYGGFSVPRIYSIIPGRVGIYDEYCTFGDACVSYWAARDGHGCTESCIYLAKVLEQAVKKFFLVFVCLVCLGLGGI